MTKPHSEAKHFSSRTVLIITLYGPDNIHQTSWAYVSDLQLNWVTLTTDS